MSLKRGGLLTERSLEGGLPKIRSGHSREVPTYLGGLIRGVKSNMPRTSPTCTESCVAGDAAVLENHTTGIKGEVVSAQRGLSRERSDFFPDCTSAYPLE